MFVTLQSLLATCLLLLIARANDDDWRSESQVIEWQMPMLSTYETRMQLSPLFKLLITEHKRYRGYECQQCPDLNPKNVQSNCPLMNRALKCGEYKVYHTVGECKTATVFCYRNETNGELGVNIAALGYRPETNFTDLFVLSNYVNSGPPYPRPFALESLEHDDFSASDLICDDQGRWTLNGGKYYIIVEHLFCAIVHKTNLNYIVDILKQPRNVTGEPQPKTIPPPFFSDV